MICLAMIVKNEAHGIVRTLESVREHVDAWCIVDTGSTDGTQDLVLDAMRNVPGALYQEAFVDFSTTRNRALALAHRNSPDGRGHDVWRFMISGDAVVEHAELLADVVARCKAQDAVAAHVQIRSGGMEWSQTMLTRGAAGCAFGGVTHEAMNVPPRAKVIDSDVERARGFFVRYEAPPNENRRPRWEMDRELLERELSRLTPQERRTRTREVFYLAQTYECLHEYGHAMALYRERISLPGGFDEERFIAKLRIARCYWRIGALREEVLGAFRDASQERPDRAEPLFEAATYCRALGDWRGACKLARKAAALPVPKGSPLFLEVEIYLWRAADLLVLAAFHRGQWQESADVSGALLAGRTLPERERVRVAGNRRAALLQLSGLASREAPPIAL